MLKKLFYFFILPSIFLMSIQPAKADDAAYLVSEIKTNKGELKVKFSKEKGWNTLKPLQNLKDGDTVSATKNAYAVLFEISEGKTVTVKESNSPFTVRQSQKKGESSIKNVLTKLAGSLTGKKKDTNYVPLVVRSAILRKPSIIMSKDTYLLSQKPMFVWTGSTKDDIIIRLKKSSGEIVFSKTVSRGYNLKYPDDVAPLIPGAYSWEMELEDGSIQKGEFKIPEERIKKSILEKIKAIEALNLPKITKAVIKSEMLLSEGFIEDARLELVQAYLTDKEEPTVHLLLGEIYRKIGQNDLALEEFDEAQYLLE